MEEEGRASQEKKELKEVDIIKFKNRPHGSHLSLHRAKSAWTHTVVAWVRRLTERRPT